jgi:hypothetical protein
MSTTNWNIIDYIVFRGILITAVRSLARFHIAGIGLLAEGDWMRKLHKVPGCKLSIFDDTIYGNVWAVWTSQDGNETYCRFDRIDGQDEESIIRYLVEHGLGMDETSKIMKELGQ